MSTKFVPLTTRPASTSRQGMTRLRCTPSRVVARPRALAPIRITLASARCRYACDSAGHRSRCPTRVVARRRRDFAVPVIVRARRPSPAAVGASATARCCIVAVRYGDASLPAAASRPRAQPADARRRPRTAHSRVAARRDPPTRPRGPAAAGSRNVAARAPGARATPLGRRAPAAERLAASAVERGLALGDRELPLVQRLADDHAG